MDEDRPIWERCEGEPGLWYQRFERHRLFGPDRTVQTTYQEWRVARGRERSRGCPKSWRDAAQRWDWKRRAEAWDKLLSDQAGAAVEAERLRILSTGFALRHARIEALNALAFLLQGEAIEDDKRWLADVKQIGSGENSERVDIVRFNSALVEQFRKTLEDLAYEMGERVHSLDLTSGRQPIKGYLGVTPDDWDEAGQAGESPDGQSPDGA